MMVEALSLVFGVAVAAGLGARHVWRRRWLEAKERRLRELTDDLRRTAKQLVLLSQLKTHASLDRARETERSALVERTKALHAEINVLWALVQERSRETYAQLRMEWMAAKMGMTSDELAQVDSPTPPSE